MSDAFVSAANRTTGAWFKLSADGDWIQLQVAKVTERQATEYKTNAPKFFPSGDPIMNQIINGTLLDGVSDGNDMEPEEGADAEVNLEVSKQAMRVAIGEAIQEAGGSSLDEGGVLTIVRDGYGVGSNPANPPQAFTATYELPEAE